MSGDVIRYACVLEQICRFSFQSKNYKKFCG